MNYSFLVILVIMMAYFWWSSRQQRKRAKEQEEERLNSLVKGTEVVTIGGLYGVIDEVDRDKQIMVLNVEGVFLTFELRALARIVPPAESNTVTTEDVLAVDSDLPQVTASKSEDTKVGTEEVIVEATDITPTDEK